MPNVQRASNVRMRCACQKLNVATVKTVALARFVTTAIVCSSLNAEITETALATRFVRAAIAW